jgi:RNA polymerase sigma-70 factor (ECF subfamily)
MAAAKLPLSERAGLADLADRLRRGEMAALAEAYDAHHEQVRAFARRLVGDDGAAEDLVQEAFLALPQAMKSFRGDASLRTFVIAIAANHARHHVRAAARRRAAHTRSVEEDTSSKAPATPEENTRKRELIEALTRALDELPFDQRVAIVLCEVEERTSAEAAKIAGAPEATMRTRVFHAKKKLREILQQRGVR